MTEYDKISWCPKCGQMTLVIGELIGSEFFDEQDYKVPDHCTNKDCNYDESQGAWEDNND